MLLNIPSLRNRSSRRNKIIILKYISTTKAPKHPSTNNKQTSFFLLLSFDFISLFSFVCRSKSGISSSYDCLCVTNSLFHEKIIRKDPTMVKEYKILHLGNTRNCCKRTSNEKNQVRGIIKRFFKNKCTRKGSWRSNDEEEETM